MRNCGLETLVQQLAVNRSKYDKNDRQASVRQLVLVLKFLNSVELDPDLYAPLTRLLTALVDLDEGVQHPLFNAVGPKPHVNTGREGMVMARAAIAVELWIRSKVEGGSNRRGQLNSACEWAAREMRKHDVKIGRTATRAPKVIRDWRKRVLQAKPGSRLWRPREHYRKVLEFVGTESEGWPPVAYSEVFDQSLRRKAIDDSDVKRVPRQQS